MYAGCKYECSDVLFFVGGSIFWEGRVHGVCVQRNHLSTTGESEGILINITFALFYPPLLWVPCIRNNRLCFKYLPFTIGVCSWKGKRIRKTYLEKELTEMSANLAEQPERRSHLLWRHETVLFSSYYIEPGTYTLLCILLAFGKENLYSVEMKIGNLSTLIPSQFFVATVCCFFLMHYLEHDKNLSIRVA